MKKILCIITCCFLCGPVLADYWRMGSSEACFVHANANGVKDEFFYCGDQRKGCAGNNDASYDSRNWNAYGDSVDAGSGFGKHWCCGNKWIKAKDVYLSSFTKNEAVTVTLPEGTCTYPKTIDACGNVTDNPCTEATECAGGYTKRNGKCIKFCQDGYAFETETSSECIKCDTTAYSGIVDGNCLKCDKDIEFYNKMEKKCISKSEMNKYSSEQMAKCFMCKDGKSFKECSLEHNVEKDCPKGYNPSKNNK